MSLDKTLKIRLGSSRTRNVLTRGERIARLQEEEELNSIRPDIDGNQIMQILNIPASRLVGQAYNYLLELRLEHGPLGEERAIEELKKWFKENGPKT